MARLDGEAPAVEDVSTEISAIGFAEIVPSNGRWRLDCPAHLVHRITGEDVELGQELLDSLGIHDVPMDGAWSLCVADGRLRLAYQERIVSSVSDVFRTHIFAGPSGRWCLRDASGAITWFCRSDWDRPLRYLTLQCPESQVFKVWQLPAHVRGAQHWFCLNDIWAFEPMFSSVHASRGICDAIRNMAAMCKSLGLQESLILKRTVRGHGHDDSSRMLDSHTVSSTGWVLLVSLQAYGKHERKPDMRHHAERYRAYFDCALSLLFKDVSADLVYDPDLAMESIQVCCKPLKSKRIVVGIEQGEVAFDEVARDPLFCKLAKHCNFDLDGSMTLTDFMGHLTRSRKVVPRLFKQLVIALGQWVDALLPGHLGADSLAAARAQPASKMTYDPVLADAIAMGELAEPREDGTGKDVIVNVPQAVKMVARLKMSKNFDLWRRWGSILRRYWVAGRSHFGQESAGKVVLCHDASRFREDTLFSLLGSYGGTDKFMTMIPPPQAHRRISPISQPLFRKTRLVFL